MSPDERAVAVLIDAAMRRARVLLIAEAAAWAAVAAAVVFGVTGVLGLGLPARLAAIAVAELAVAMAVGLSRRRDIGRAAVVRALEAAEPAARNVLITASELSTGDLEARPAARARVFADAAAIMRAADPGRALPSVRVGRTAAVACAAWAVAGAFTLWRGGAVGPASDPTAARRAMSSPPGSSVTVTIQPPAYTGLPQRTLTDPPQIEAVEGSTATLAMGTWTSRAVLEKTGYLATGDGDRRRTIPVVVTPDAWPAATILKPGRDLVYGGGNPLIAFEAQATDDFGLRGLTLEFTKVFGSGEQFEFEEGEIPLTIARESGREWRGSASRSLAELKLKEGDMLVYRAVAADMRPGDGRASSDAYFIEVSRMGVAAGDGFTLPEHETRYALSQQMLIIKTGRLIEARAAMAPGDVSEAALNLAVEQRMIRAEFVFMLGGEVEDEEVEAEQSTELQEGRLRNRGQRDLRAATIAMSQAEQRLAGADLPAALVAERAAVAALERAFARGRYILRALTGRITLDPSRRLTGDLSNAAGWRRTPAAAPADRRVALLQDLLGGLADLDSANRANRHSDFESRARVLAEEALRIDATSESLREAATALQRAADARDAAERQRALTAASMAASIEARRSNRGAPLAVKSVGGSLAGALSDRASGKRSR